METALRWRIEKAQKEIQRLEKDKKKVEFEISCLQLEGDKDGMIPTKRYELGFIDGQIIAHQMEIGSLEDLLMMNEILEKQKKLREVI